MGEYCEAGELGGTDFGGVEGGDEIRAVRVWRLVFMRQGMLVAGASVFALFQLI